MAIDYRPDIDGLRAVAVLSVIVYHAGLKWLSGGYFGVDVFFVISGFLITSILYGELRDGNFSILRFYDRRVRRILPALCLVLLVSSFVAVFLLSPMELRSFGQSTTATALFLSNFFFWQEAGYFAPHADELPLLHTWSLAVEEQFYIAFPIVLWVLSCGSKFALNLGITILLLGSFALAASFISTSPDAVFYLAPFRIWELLLGAMIALPIVPRVPFGWAGILSALGLLFIVVAILCFDSTTAFVGPAALVPCAGAALIIHAGRGQEIPGFVGRLLGSHPFRFVGRISYSLYLWHWPIFVFLALYLLHPLSHPEAIAACLLTFVAAALSWRFVEQPFRGSRALGPTIKVRLATGGFY